MDNCNMGKDIVERLKAMEGKIDKLTTEQIPDIRIEVEKLKIKAGLWGLVAGSIPVIGAVFMLYFRKGM